MCTSPKPGKRSTTDGRITLLLLVVAFALRVPFRSQYAYHWDGAQFALAIQAYNVALSQPHAPGYFLYVMLGRLVNFAVGDPHASLVWLDVLFGSAVPVVLYGLGSGMFGRRAGLAAGLFALTSPQFWFHSEVALTYVVDACGICLTVWWCWRALQRGGTWGDAVGVGVLVAVVGGIRQQTVPVLLPLLAYVFWHFSTRRLLKLLVAILVALGLGASWFFPMLHQSEGWRVYWDIVRRYNQNNASGTLTGGGWPALFTNCYLSIAFCWNGLLLGVVPLVGAVVYRVWGMSPQQKQVWDTAHRRAGRVLALWIVPMVLFGTVIQFTSQPGHVLGYLPALLSLSAAVVAQLRRNWCYLTVVGLVAAGNIFVFLAWPQRWDDVLLGYGRTAREIRQHDRQVAQVVTAIRSRYQPADTVICHALAAHYSFGLRIFQLHLPEFRQYQLAPDPTIPSPPGKPLWCVQGEHLSFVSGLDTENHRQVLLVVPPGMDVNIYARYFTPLITRPVEGSGNRLYELLR